MFRFEAQQLIIDDASLYRAPARRIDQENHCLGARIFERTPHGSHYHFGASVRARGDFTLDLHHGGVARRRDAGGTAFADQYPGSKNKEPQPSQSHKNAPTARNPLFIE